VTDHTPDRRPKSVTIYDVAEAAGVAASTVSRAFTRPGRVSPETAERIRRVAEELGYRERASVHPEVRSRNRMVLVTVASLGNLFYFDTLNGIQDEAAAAGYTVLVVDGRLNPVIEQQGIERTLDIADGVIMISPRIADSIILRTASQKPVVLINRVLRDVPSVVQNINDGMKQVVEHLVELGHRNVTFIQGPAQAWISAPRWDALEAACLAHRIPMRKIGPVEPTVRGGVGVLPSWLEYRTTAVVAFNDDVALGFSYAARERGYRVPQDVSVVGIDNTMATSVFAPPLTTLAVAGHGQGTVALRRILQELKGGRTKAPAMVVPMKLIKRASTGPAPS
jgi:Transcriptional regulators